VAARYFRELWGGEIPFSRVFWNDMLIVGTTVNIVALLAAMLILSSSAPAVVGLIIHLLPIPYNLALAVGASRSAEVIEPRWAWIAQAIATLWFIAMLFV
jgi:hypothetical protein